MCSDKIPISMATKITCVLVRFKKQLLKFKIRNFDKICRIYSLKYLRVTTWD